MFYILVDDILKAKFFISFAKFDNVIYLTNKPSCYLFLKLKTTREVIFLKSINNAKADVDIERLKNTISVLNGRQSLSNAVKNYQQVFFALFNTLKSRLSSNDTVVLFNGNHASAIATADFFRSHNAKTLYSEISNLPGKMIFDPSGVNAQSVLFKRPEILDTLPIVADEVHKKWVARYIDYKSSPLPQSRINVKTYAVIAFDDFMSRIFPLFIREDSLPLSKKINMFIDKYKSRKILASNIRANLDVDSEYVFYPTQVTSDTQLKINSEVDNIGAINKIIELEKGQAIYVKIHPAESDISTINFFRALADEKKIILVNNNTIELIRKARKVYTINSTVGLESLIFEKDLVVLGRAIYSNFNSSRLQQYIHSYLVDLDYFGENDINSSHIDKMKELTEI
ncbi:hypothetical protein N5923_15205 [Erwiniaceae bacterium BAC15a-03b]|uniref:Capsular polysaccharide biosynthesis protein n=1 Tax=Winslowiella arboricola TaxID=2978220 RepID=A0A9J6PXV7_9GAMM|nr:hypothetical protein [Winslowiella arboricola]MCU5774292.1 hypothetical protein [Winslowiella arboricola]MCU5778839.1 hypothetical protein [Winslowiella arboricola]